MGYSKTCVSHQRSFSAMLSPDSVCRGVVKPCRSRRSKSKNILIKQRVGTMLPLTVASLYLGLITGGSQLLGGAGAREDRTDDRHARLARDITDHLGQLEVHLLKGFLHVLLRARGHRHQHTPLPQVAAPHTDLVRGTKGAAP